MESLQTQVRDELCKSLRASAVNFTNQTDPDGEGAVFAADGAAAVRTAGLRGAAVLLLLLEDLRVEFLQRRN